MASPVTTAVHLAPQLRRICDINSTRVSVIAPAGPSRREVALGVPTVLLNSLAVAQVTCAAGVDVIVVAWDIRCSHGSLCRVLFLWKFALVLGCS